ncbi:hypothetical protein D9M70_453960 [compost metagenome]
MPSKAMSSRRPTKGETKVAPALAASRAWLAEKHSVTLVWWPSEVSALQALRPSSVSGSLMQMLSAIFERTAASFIISAYSVAVTSAETGPSTIEQISLVTSVMSRPDFRISEGSVVTPSRRPRSFSSRISLTSAVSTKNFMESLLGHDCRSGASLPGRNSVGRDRAR